MKILPLLLLAALGGCVYTPERLLEEGTRYEWRSTQQPRDAGLCFARNAANSTKGSWRPTPPRPLTDRGAYRVTIAGWGMADFEPAGTGSRVIVLVRPGTGASYVSEFMEGC